MQALSSGSPRTVMHPQESLPAALSSSWDESLPCIESEMCSFPSLGASVLYRLGFPQPGNCGSFLPPPVAALSPHNVKQMVSRYLLSRDTCRERGKRKSPSHALHMGCWVNSTSRTSLLFPWTAEKTGTCSEVTSPKPQSSSDSETTQCSGRKCKGRGTEP